MENEFEGVFKFTNASDEDFVVMWNSKEYTFPAQSTCPMIIPNEPLENVQAIRKKFAYKYAQREFAKSKEGKAIEKEGAKHLNPATYNEQILEKFVQQCLTPLPVSSAKVATVTKQKTKFIDNGTAIIDEGAGVSGLSSPNGAFADYVPPVLGKME